MNKKQKPYWNMTAAELAEATKDFDREFAPTKPLNAKMKSRLKRAERGPGRPKIGKGAKSVLISVEQDLLKQADAFARKNHLSRSQLIAQLLRKLPKAG